MALPLPATLTMTMTTLPQTLSPIEARILGVLIEKEKTTPDVYPLTVNSLLSGCNQKTSREPVMTLGESEIQTALDELRHRTLVIDTYGASGRVMRYAHNFRKVYGVPGPSVALLATLMLRGPQTAAELRANCDRLNRFSDVSSAEAYLEELAAWPAGALAIRLPKQPGSSAHRWAHLLCGEVAIDATPARTGNTDSLALEQRVSELEAEVADLRAELAALIARLGG
jgi:uncharacterized protein YceH (UPF0502 family)